MPTCLATSSMVIFLYPNLARRPSTASRIRSRISERLAICLIVTYDQYYILVIFRCQDGTRSLRLLTWPPRRAQNGTGLVQKGPRSGIPVEEALMRVMRCLLVIGICTWLAAASPGAGPGGGPSKGETAGQKIDVRKEGGITVRRDPKSPAP